MQTDPRRRHARVGLAALLLACLLASAASAHPIRYWWKYDPALFRANHTWESHGELRERHRTWHGGHRRPKPGKRAAWRKRHLAFHHRVLDHLHQDLHAHQVVRTQAGKASWYDGEGKPGACGAGLHGLYAAHRKWPCGTLVSVKSGDSYVFVRVLDRGPFVDERVIDLSPRAFRQLAPTDRGVVDVEIFQLSG